MVPHGAGVGVYVRGALSGLRPDARKSKHGLKTIFSNRLGRRSTVEPGPTGGSLNRSALACLIYSTEATGWQWCQRRKPVDQNRAGGLF
jgi:hypothetical protein